MQTASNTHTSPRVGLLLGMSAGLAAVPTFWLWDAGTGGVRVWTAGGPVRPDEALLPFIALGALLGILWLACCLGLELLACLPGAVGQCTGRAAARLSPRQVRRVIAALLGIGITAGLVPGAHAVGAAPPSLTAAAPAPSPGPDPAFRSLPDPGWVPSAPTVRPQPDVRVLSPGPRADATPRGDATEVVVHRGDSLWAIAARHLGAGVSDGQIAEAWPAWYAANLDVIGADPDLLLPGQVLRVPEAVGS